MTKYKKDYTPMPEYVVLSTDLSLDFIPPLHLGMPRY